jgi:hypothetical protein
MPILPATDATLGFREIILMGDAPPQFERIARCVSSCVSS